MQCWTSLEQNYGVVPCALMSMMSESLLPSACETDVPGLIGMMAMQYASGKPSALLDWNNNYGDDPDKAVLFHCSNLPKSFFVDHKMDYQAIIAGSVGKDSTHGTVVGRIKPGPFTFCRVSTDDEMGEIMAYVGEGHFTDDALGTFGGLRAWPMCRISRICSNTSATTGLSTMSPPICPRSATRSARPSRPTSAGMSTSIHRQGKGRGVPRGIAPCPDLSR